MRKLAPSLLLVLLALPQAAHADPVSLNAWTAESYPAVSGFNPGIWTVAGDGNSVVQSVNGQPTLFYSDFNAFGTMVTGRISSAGSDDDLIGFALGFSGGDTTNPAADYLLVDWKRSSQSFDFGTPSSSPGGTAPIGLAVSRATGIPDADEFWQHANLSGTPAGSGLVELARATTLGSTGWATNVEYAFSFDFGPTDLVISVDGVQQFDLDGNFANGRMAFYNFSQAGVTYSAFDTTPGTFVPEPTSATLLGFGVAGAAWLARRRTETRACRG